MSGSRINRGGRPIPGAVNAEFTPGQIVVGICVLIFAAVIFFLAGVLVGRNDPTTAQVIDTTTPPPLITETPTQAAPPATKAAVPPAQVAATTPPPAQPPSAPPITPAADLKKGTPPGGPRSVDLPPLADAKSSNRTVEVPVQMPPPLVPDAPDTKSTTKPDTKSTAKSDAKTSTETLPPLPGSTKTEVAGEKAPADTKKAPADAKKSPVPANGYIEPELAEELLETIGGPENAPAKPAATPKSGTAAAPKAPASTGKGGGFGIQVGSFSKPNREEQANSVKSSVEAAGLTAEVRPTADKSMYRVLVVGFPDRASAIKALNDLKQRPGFEKAFIQNLSQL